MDYNKITNKTEETEMFEEVVQEEEATIEPEETIETIIGCVSGCRRLNIRKRPNKEVGEVVAILNIDDFVMIIEPEKAKGDWYKVVAEVDGEEVKGFCMKEFVTID